MAELSFLRQDEKFGHPGNETPQAEACATD
jgi:hypothetical protein